ncbi:MAG: haloacid dehalogenase-like hydrolase [Hyphomicrobiales bacterium]
MFDFDGTLVDTAPLKKRAFFDVFPKVAPYAEIVAAELAADPDGSRHVVIPRMAARMRIAGLDVDDAPEAARIDHYGRLVADAVSAAPEVAGAGALLAAAHRVAEVHVASATPVEPLRAEIDRRGWTRFLAGSHGYPARKPDVVRALMMDGRHAADATVVIGDGVSDAEAAEANGAAFHRILAPPDLAPVWALLGVRP